jgi:hypothetical protein
MLSESQVAATNLIEIDYIRDQDFKKEPNVNCTSSHRDRFHLPQQHRIIEINKLVPMVVDSFYVTNNRIPIQRLQNNFRL